MAAAIETTSPAHLSLLRRRDRRGRGIRGPVLSPVVPAYRTRAERFDAAILDSLSYLSNRWAAELAKIDFAVEHVPPSDPAPWESTVALARCFAADSGLNARIVLYRQPIEAHSPAPGAFSVFVHEIIVEQLSLLLAHSPSEIDPNIDD